LIQAYTQLIHTEYIDVFADLQGYTADMLNTQLILTFCFFPFMTIRITKEI